MMKIFTGEQTIKKSTAPTRAISLFLIGAMLIAMMPGAASIANAAEPTSAQTEEHDAVEVGEQNITQASAQDSIKDSIKDSTQGALEKNKEEVVYIMSNANGEPNSAYVVNMFGPGSVTDYGHYSAVKMLNTEDDIFLNDDAVTFSSQAEKVYYQGDLNSCDTPWTTKISYYLDEQEISPNELAGKSGKLKIDFDISKNKAYTGREYFYKNYAIQATFLFDTEKCTNILAADATSANVGGKKQLTFTALPNKGLHTAITADVSDFEMESIAINGIKLNLNVDLDTGSLLKKLTHLSNGITTLNNGSNDLNSGANDVKNGALDLYDGTKKLHSGLSTMNTGIEKLNKGIKRSKNSLKKLKKASSTLTDNSGKVLTALTQIDTALSAFSIDSAKIAELTQASTSIKAGISKLAEGVTALSDSVGYTQYKGLMKQNGLDIDTLKKSNVATIEQLQNQVAALQTQLDAISNNAAMATQADQLQAQIKTFGTIITLLQANNGAIGGTQTYLDGVSTNITALKTSILELQTKYTEFDTGITELTTTLTNSLVSLGELATGIKTLTTKYSALDDGISDYSAGVKRLVKGYQKIASGVATLAAGSGNAVDGSSSLNTGAHKLYNGTKTLANGTDRLSDGTNKLHNKTAGMDKKVQNKIDNILDSLKVNSKKCPSFVSDKNKNIASVQFVIKTDAIKLPEVEQAPITQTEDLNFWQKLLRLFGIE